MTSRKALEKILEKLYLIPENIREDLVKPIQQDLDRLEELIKLIEILDWYRIMMPYKTFADILEYSNDRVFINNIFNKEWYRRRKNIKKELENDK